MRTEQPQTERLSEGTIIGPYAVARFVRQGGMASIYFGHHISTDAKVAIKVISLACADEPILRARFERESELMGRMIGVRNVAKVLDSGELEDGRLYLVMEWVEGNDLDELLEQVRDQDERLEVATATRYALGIARGIEALHLRDVVHRGLKPGNVMIERVEGRDLTAKIVDFGISADLAPAPVEEDLGAGRTLGTDKYTSPEQAQGGPPDPSMDIWSFGALLMELYGTARIPANLRTEGIPLGFHVSGPREIRPKIMRLIRGCLAKDPAARPTAEKVRLYLENITQRLEALADPQQPAPELRPRVVAMTDLPEMTAEDSGYLSAMLQTDASAPTPPERDRTLIRAPPPFAEGSEIVADVLYPVPHGGTEPAVLSDLADDAFEDPLEPEAPTVVRTGTTQPNRRTAPEPDAPRHVAESPRLPAALWIVWGAAAVLLAALVGWSTWRGPGREAEISAAAPASAGVSVAGTQERPALPRTETVAKPQAPAREPDRENGSAPPTVSAPEDAPAQDPVPQAAKAPSEEAARFRPPGQRGIPVHATEGCRARRERAERALSDRAWIDVLSETKPAQCWSSPTPRRLMRVKALLELGWFEQCVDEGIGDDPRLRPMVATCHKLLPR